MKEATIRAQQWSVYAQRNPLKIVIPSFLRPLSIRGRAAIKKKEEKANEGILAFIANLRRDIDCAFFLLGLIWWWEDMPLKIMLFVCHFFFFIFKSI